jgi:hypothetical protein
MRVLNIPVIWSKMLTVGPLITLACKLIAFPIIIAIMSMYISILEVVFWM